MHINSLRFYSQLHIKARNDSVLVEECDGYFWISP